MNNHRIDTTQDHQHIFRIKGYNGIEYHILGKHVYEALEKFRTHPMFDERIISVVNVAKVDL